MSNDDYWQEMDEAHSAFVEEMAQHCDCDNGPCESVLCGGGCDHVHLNRGEPEPSLEEYYDQ